MKGDTIMTTDFIKATTPNEYLRGIEANYKKMVDGQVPEHEAFEFVSAILPFAKPCNNNANCWFWMYDAPETMPSDCRVAYVYETTYMLTGVIIYVLTKYESVKSIKEIGEILPYVLNGCMGRDFLGHGFDDLAGFVRAMKIFAQANVTAFLNEYSSEYEEFKVFFEEKKTFLKSQLVTGIRKGDWGEDYSESAGEALDLLDNYNVPKRVFVYGTLMRGQRAHKFLDGARYVGEYSLSGYLMYNCGSFPGIKKTDNGYVIGEVYEITDEFLPELDMYEGEGSLYEREIVWVKKGSESLRAYVYVYRGEPSGCVMKGTWGMKESDEVWYACYGSNLCADRFKCYIEGGTCKDNGRYYEGCRNNKSLWTDSKVKRFPGTMYFGNESGSWGGKGVAFYTDAYKGETIMRLYKITWGQLLEVQRQEGSSSNWYGNVLCLGIDEDGCPVYTLTSDNIRKKNAPSENYVKLISRALVEECGILEDDAAAYLSHCVAD